MEPKWQIPRSTPPHGVGRTVAAVRVWTAGPSELMRPLDTAGSWTVRVRH